MKLAESYRIMWIIARTFQRASVDRGQDNFTLQFRTGFEGWRYPSGFDFPVTNDYVNYAKSPCLSELSPDGARSLGSHG